MPHQMSVPGHVLQAQRLDLEHTDLGSAKVQLAALPHLAMDHATAVALGTPAGRSCGGTMPEPSHECGAAWPGRATHINLDTCELSQTPAKRATRPAVPTPSCDGG